MNNRRKSSARVEDFEEEEVWSVPIMKEKEVSSPNMRKSRNFHCSSSGSSSAWHGSTAPLMIPKTNQDGQVAKNSSAPLNIPDWSKIYGKNARMVSLDRNRDGDGNEDEDDDDGDMVPPHEWLAKKLERSQISSFSVCEGIGRTLKGRDLSKVRNAVLTKTGFLE